MITYQEIEEANKKIKPVNIKDKSYMEVNQRIKAFRMVYPTGVIETEMVSNEPNEEGIHTCIFRAFVGYRDETELYKLGTGTAYEKEDSTFINKTSYIENCETSAVGRALGMAGFGIDTSVASAEEVTNAINNQKIEQKGLTPYQLETLTNLDRPLKDHLVEVYKKDITQLTETEAITAIESLKKKGLIK